MHPAGRAAIEALGHRADRAENLLVILGRIGLDTDEAGSFRRPLRDAHGDTARWVVSLSVSWRTAHRCIVELEALDLIASGVCFRNPSGPRPRRSWRPTTRPRLLGRPNVKSCETRQPCGCGRWWLRWHNGRLDALCRRCHRSAALRKHRERALPTSLAPKSVSLAAKCHTKEQGSSLTRSSRSLTARSPTRRTSNRKSQTGIPVQRRSPRRSPCFGGRLDSWLTGRTCSSLDCQHPTPSRPDGSGPNPWCRCCWQRRARPAHVDVELPQRSAVEELVWAGASPDVVVELLGPDSAAEASTAAARLSGTQRLDEAVAATAAALRAPTAGNARQTPPPLGRSARPRPGASQCRMMSRPREGPDDPQPQTPTSGPAEGLHRLGGLRRLGPDPDDTELKRRALQAAVEHARGHPDKYGPLLAAATPPPLKPPDPSSSTGGNPDPEPPPERVPARQPDPVEEPPPDPVTTAPPEGDQLAAQEQLRRLRALRDHLRRRPAPTPVPEGDPAADAAYREALETTRALEARRRARILTCSND